MPRPGFKRDPKVIAKILKTVDGGKRAAAQRIFDALPDDVKDEAKIVEYETDREVIGIVVPADRQAKHGVATRAVSQARDS